MCLIANSYEQCGAIIICSYELWPLFPQSTDILDHNAVYLQEIASKITSKKICKANFDGENVKKVIQKYMICVEGQGNIDSSGTMLDLGAETRQGCRRSGNGTDVSNLRVYQSVHNRNRRTDYLSRVRFATRNH